MQVAHGTVLGGYESLGKLGAGGMSVVLEARRLSDGQRVALKLPLGRRGADARLTRRLMREARAIRKLENHHVARLLEVVELEDHVPLLVLELLRGRDLARVLREDGPLKPRSAVHIMLEACEGVMAAHACGIVHRDIKPSNLFLAEQPDGSKVIKLLDFGLARTLALGSASVPGDDSTLTASDAVVGSPRYLAPEVVRDAGMAQPSCDIWSLGVVAYELITGRAPFEAPTVAGLLARIVTDAPAPLSRYAPDAPAELARVIAKALAKDPKERHESVEALARDLRAFLDEKEGLPRYRRPALVAAALAASISAAIAGVALRSGDTIPLRALGPALAPQPAVLAHSRPVAPTTNEPTRRTSTGGTDEGALGQAAAAAPAAPRHPTPSTQRSVAARVVVNRGDDAAPVTNGTDAPPASQPTERFKLGTDPASTIATRK